MHILTSEAICKVSISFIMPNLEKVLTTMDFNRNLAHICGVAEMSIDMLQHYVPQTTAAKLAKCML